MITKFKIFEKKGDIFNIGDWVLLKSNCEIFWNVYHYVKIIDKESTKNHDSGFGFEEPLNDYEIETFTIKTELSLPGKIKTFWVNDFEIDRKLTPKEIEQTEAKYLANKYNI